MAKEVFKKYKPSRTYQLYKEINYSLWHPESVAGWSKTKEWMVSQEFCDQAIDLAFAFAISKGRAKIAARVIDKLGYLETLDEVLKLEEVQEQLIGLFMHMHARLQPQLQGFKLTEFGGIVSALYKAVRYYDWLFPAVSMHPRKEEVRQLLEEKRQQKSTQAEKLRLLLQNHRLRQ